MSLKYPKNSLPPVKKAAVLKLQSTAKYHFTMFISDRRGYVCVTYLVLLSFPRTNWVHSWTLRNVDIMQSPLVVQMLILSWTSLYSRYRFMDQSRSASFERCKQLSVSLLIFYWMSCTCSSIFLLTLSEFYLTMRPAARKGYGSIAHEAKPNGL